MTKSKVTKAQAEKVLGTLKKMFPDGDFFLASHEHEEMPPGCWSIAWEGSGLDFWPGMASESQFLKPGTFPAEVFIEPMTSWCLGLYPA